MQYILTHKKKIKNELLEKNNFIEKNIAILGGSTTSEIKNILELFLLDYGIKPVFYESEFGKYYEDIMFENEELDKTLLTLNFVNVTNVYFAEGTYEDMTFTVSIPRTNALSLKTLTRKPEWKSTRMSSCG